jgi:hypothetical protein
MCKSGMGNLPSTTLPTNQIDRKNSLAQSSSVASEAQPQMLPYLRPVEMMMLCLTLLIIVLATIKHAKVKAISTWKLKK